MIDWNAVVVEYGPLVWKKLWRILGNRSEVEESFQETFLAAFEVSKRETVDSWPAVLTRIATARGIDHLRVRYRAQRQKKMLQAAAHETRRGLGLAAQSDDAVEVAMAVELSDRLRMAIAELSVEQAEVFVLHSIDDWSYRELSQRMAISEGNVRTVLHRARQRLKELLSDK